MKTSMGNLVIMRLLKLVYVLVVAAIFYVCWQMFYMPCLNLTKLSYGLTAGLFYVILFVLLGRIYEVFSVGTYRVSHLVFSHNRYNCFHIFTSNIIVCAVSGIQKMPEMAFRFQMGGMFCIGSQRLPAFKLGIQGVIQSLIRPSDFHVL